MGRIVFTTQGVKCWQQNSVYVHNRILQPFAAFPSILAVEEGEHLKAWGIGSQNVHRNTWNPHDLIWDPDIENESTCKVRKAVPGLENTPVPPASNNMRCEGLRHHFFTFFYLTEKGSKHRILLLSTMLPLLGAPQRSVKHTTARTHFLSHRNWQSHAVKRLNIWGERAINRGHCGWSWQMWTLERGRQERPR